MSPVEFEVLGFRNEAT